MEKKWPNILKIKEFEKQRRFSYNIQNSLLLYK